MRAQHLNSVAIQRYSSIYLGEENPELLRPFSPTHKNHLLNKPNNISAQTIFKSLNEKTPKPQEASHTQITDSSPPATTSEPKPNIQSSLDYLEFVMNREKEKEIQKQPLLLWRMLVARRLAELREKNQKKVEVETSEKETQSYLQDLLDQIEAINREKQPHRMLFFKTDNIPALQKIKALNERLKPLLELLFQKLIGSPINTFDSPQTIKQLQYFKVIGEFEGHSTKKLLETITSSLKMLSQQQRQWSLHKPAETKSNKPTVR